MFNKNKYLALKNLSKLNQKGGTVTKLDESDETFKFPIPDKRFTFNTFKVDVNLYDEEFSCSLNLVKIQLDDTSNPVLFLIAGFSQDSFMSASYVILTKLKLLQAKFSAIYILDYSSMKKIQDFVCGKRKVLDHFDSKPEKLLNKKIAESIHEILSMLDLHNIHLLGKSNGGWIVTLLLKMHPESYKGLYLAVPGIPDLSESLSRIDPSILQGINFVFGFSQQDAYKFSFGAISNQEISRYDAMMASFRPIRYKSYMEDNGLPQDVKIHHELYQSMIDHIILSLL